MADFITNLSILAPAILFALTVHEASHALVANWMGDPTAKMLGRVTLNPLKHLDPMGTLAFFITAMAGAGIGWAKPVPVDGRNLRNPRKDHMWISAAGPVSNLLVAGCTALLLRVLIEAGLFSGSASWTVWLGAVLITAVRINVVLAFFNLIPLPPLDGSGVVMGLLPYKMALHYSSLDRYGMFIILGLILLPNWLPGFPNILIPLVVKPANWLVLTLLPML